MCIIAAVSAPNLAAKSSSVVMYPVIVIGVPEAMLVGGAIVIAGIVEEAIGVLVGIGVALDGCTAGALAEVAATIGAVVDAVIVEASLQPENPIIVATRMRKVKINGNPFIDFFMFICLPVKTSI